MTAVKAGPANDFDGVLDLALSAVLEFEPMAIWRWDATSGALEQIYRPRHPLFPDSGDLTMDWWMGQILSPPVEEVRRVLSAVIESGQSLVLETQVLDAVGNLRALHSSLVRDDSLSRPGPGVLGVTRDFSAQRQLERDKFGADLQLKASIDAAPYGVGIVDANYIARVMNRAGAELLGAADPNQFIGRDARLNLLPEIVPEYLSLIHI